MARPCRKGAAGGAVCVVSGEQLRCSTDRCHSHPRHAPLPLLLLLFSHYFFSLARSWLLSPPEVSLLFIFRPPMLLPASCLLDQLPATTVFFSSPFFTPRSVINRRPSCSTNCYHFLQDHTRLLLFARFPRRFFLKSLFSIV